eukprot:gene51849-36083_t
MCHLGKDSRTVMHHWKFSDVPKVAVEGPLHHLLNVWLGASSERGATSAAEVARDAAGRVRKGIRYMTPYWNDLVLFPSWASGERVHAGGLTDAYFALHNAEDELVRRDFPPPADGLCEACGGAAGGVGLVFDCAPAFLDPACTTVGALRKLPAERRRSIARAECTLRGKAEHPQQLSRRVQTNIVGAPVGVAVGTALGRGVDGGVVGATVGIMVGICSQAIETAPRVAEPQLGPQWTAMGALMGATVRAGGAVGGAGATVGADNMGAPEGRGSGAAVAGDSVRGAPCGAGDAGVEGGVCGARRAAHAAGSPYDEYVQRSYSALPASRQRPAPTMRHRGGRAAVGAAVTGADVGCVEGKVVESGCVEGGPAA